jgi:hypothetical protein
MNLSNYARFPGFHAPRVSRKATNFSEAEEKQDRELTHAEAIRRLHKTVWWMGVMVITLLIEIMALQFYYLRDMTDRFNRTDEQLNIILQELKGVPPPQEYESNEWYSPDLCQPHEYPRDYADPEPSEDYASI